MRAEPPELTAAFLRQTVATQWGLDPDTVVYRPVGFGSHHWELTVDDRRWFLTVDDLDSRLRSTIDDRSAARDRLAAALRTARELADAGLNFVVAPVPAADGAVAVSLDDRFVAAVYPYVEGTAREWGDFASRSERLDVLDLVTRVHATASASAGIDDLIVAMGDELLFAIDDLRTPWDTGPYAERARHLLDEHTGPLLRLLDAQAQLAAESLGAPERFVLTHGEPHPGNTIVTTTGTALVDWDTVLMAPPERDLWTVAGDDRRVLDAYTAATDTPVEDDVLTCYRLSWDLTEVALYIALLRQPHTDTADVAESWRNLEHFLRPRERWPTLC